MQKVYRLWLKLLELAGHVHTILWIIGGSGMITVVAGTIQKLVHVQLDWVLLCSIFAVSTLMIYLASRSKDHHGIAQNAKQSPKTVEWLKGGRPLTDNEAAILSITRQSGIDHKTLQDLIRDAAYYQKKHESLVKNLGWSLQLKETAREIRRRWPGSEFETCPALKRSWIPSVGYSPDWLEPALSWHSSLWSHEKLKNRLQSNSSYIESLGFDDLMDLLDNLERDYLGLRTRCTECAVAASPCVVASDYRSGGVTIQNLGSPPAYEVSLESVQIGAFRLDMAQHHIPTLLKEHPETLISTELIEVDGAIGEASHDQDLRKLVSAEIQRNTRRPILFRLLYMDATGRPYASRHEFTDSRAFIKFINCEELIIPPATPVTT